MFPVESVVNEFLDLYSQIDLFEFSLLPSKWCQKKKKQK